MKSRIALGTRKCLLVFERSGSQWSLVEEAHEGFQVPYCATDPDSGTMIACLEHGHFGSKLFRRREGESGWTELAAPRYPDGAKLSDGRPAVLRYLWCLTFGGQRQPGRLYLGTVPGGLFVSDDEGDSFTLVDSLWNHPSRLEAWQGGGFDDPGVHSVLIDPNNSDRWFVGVSVAGMFVSEDAGRSWEPRNRGLRADYLPSPDVEVGHDPHLIAQCRADPDVLWQQNHCGVHRSTDAGATWHEVSQEDGPVDFGFAVAADPECSETAWVVPAVSDMSRVAVDRALCVCRTEDGGRSWVRLGNGLPQSHCYEIAFRHALDQQGDELVFGTTTGNLYASGDRGDSWERVAGHLPPIYSVRYV